jgi:hypothetical protein
MWLPKLAPCLERSLAQTIREADSGDGDEPFSSSSRDEQGRVHLDDLPGRWLTGGGFQPDG